MKNASGLFDLNRNLGRTVGLALIDTLLIDRTDLRLARLHEAVTWGDVHRGRTLEHDRATLPGIAEAQLEALKQLAGSSTARRW